MKMILGFFLEFFWIISLYACVRARVPHRAPLYCLGVPQWILHANYVNCLCCTYVAFTGVPHGIYLLKNPGVNLDFFLTNLSHQKGLKKLYHVLPRYRLLKLRFQPKKVRRWLEECFLKLFSLCFVLIDWYS